MTAERSTALTVSVDEPRNNGERVIEALLTAGHLLVRHELLGLLLVQGRRLGVEHSQVYLADLQQEVLVPFVGPDGPGVDQTVGPLAVDATLAGRAYQQVQVLTRTCPASRSGCGCRCWTAASAWVS